MNYMARIVGRFIAISLIVTSPIFPLSLSQQKGRESSDVQSNIERLRAAEAKGGDTLPAFNDLVTQARQQGRVVLPALIKALKETERSRRSDVVRMGATAALVEIGSPAIPDLTERLDDQSILVSFTAADAISQIDGAQAIGIADRIISGNSSFTLKQRATYILGRVGGEKSVDVLVKALSDDQLRHEAALALVQIGEAAIPALTGVLQKVREADVNSQKQAFAAARALGLIGQPALSSVEQVLLDGNPIGQGFAMYALELMGNVSVGLFIRHLTNPAIDQKSRDLRGLAMQGLTNMGKPAVPQLVRVLQTSTGGPNGVITRKVTLTVLGSIGDPSARRAVQQMQNRLVSARGRGRELQRLV
jgi:HEAT repeat protein